MSMMPDGSLEIIAKVIGLLASAIATYKVFSEVANGRFSRAKEELEYCEKLISACHEKEHPLKIEKLFESIYRRRVKSAVICRLVCDWESPTNGIHSYLMSRDYIRFCDDMFIFDQKYKNDKYRKVLKLTHVIAYFICFGLAFVPLMFIDYSKYTVSNYLTLLLFVSGLIGFAMTSLRGFFKLSVAEKFVEESERIGKREKAAGSSEGGIKGSLSAATAGMASE